MARELRFRSAANVKITQKVPSGRNVRPAAAAHRTSAQRQKSMHDRETAAELVGLISEMLQQHGHNIEGKDGPICCLASNEFVVAMYLVEPSHAFYEILRHDDGENMLKVFTAVRRMGSNTIDLRLYRDGPWQKSFRSFVDETTDPGRARNLIRRTDLGLMKLH
jgi:hypothetical protein